MIKRLTILFLFFIFLNASSALWAEELKGLSVDELKSKLGKADSIDRKLQSSKEVWHYGNSLVFIENEIVTAWSDSGEIQARQNLSKIRDGSKSDHQIFSGRWTNLWTPKQTLSEREIADELVSEVLSDLGSLDGDQSAPNDDGT